MTPDVRSFLVLWAQAFNAPDIEQLVALYAPDAMLYGTTSAELHSGAEEIRTYFGGRDPVKFETWRSARLGDNLVLVVGDYVFSRSLTDQVVTIPARFTLVLSRKRGSWRILHHHSSRRP
ncbi:nuclear transport factor 2 family protein [Bradyrhizobium nanningense]|uniref:nuclear transport factor 2 family protein n=1 Tax=Bradyrhizobium nanningense TaxID=1325118 RepID=UPI001FE17D39|nr:nuclear transport factor 2 family protein [Bradyrhizobium nanningense]